MSAKDYITTHAPEGPPEGATHVLDGKRWARLAAHDVARAGPCPTGARRVLVHGDDGWVINPGAPVPPDRLRLIEEPRWREGDRVTLRAVDDPAEGIDAPREAGEVLTVDVMTWGTSYVVEVDERHREDDGDDGLRECGEDDVDDSDPPGRWTPAGPRPDGATHAFGAAGGPRYARLVRMQEGKAPGSGWVRIRTWTRGRGPTFRWTDYGRNVGPEELRRLP